MSYNKRKQKREVESGEQGEEGGRSGRSGSSGAEVDEGPCRPQQASTVRRRMRRCWSTPSSFAKSQTPHPWSQRSEGIQERERVKVVCFGGEGESHSLLLLWCGYCCWHGCTRAFSHLPVDSFSFLSNSPSNFHKTGHLPNIFPRPSFHHHLRTNHFRHGISNFGFPFYPFWPVTIPSRFNHSMTQPFLEVDQNLTYKCLTYSESIWTKLWYGISSLFWPFFFSLDKSTNRIGTGECPVFLG